MTDDSGRSERSGAGRDDAGGDADRPTQQGPARQRIIDEQEARRTRDSLGGAASYQADPEQETPGRARRTETGTAARAENAAGLESDPYHQDDAERAFRESRGDQPGER